jgi:hypothetical protein
MDTTNGALQWPRTRTEAREARIQTDWLPPLVEARCTYPRLLVASQTVAVSITKR